jgi:hypothetical protein
MYLSQLIFYKAQNYINLEMKNIIMLLKLHLISTRE